MSRDNLPTDEQWFSLYETLKLSLRNQGLEADHSADLAKHMARELNEHLIDRCQIEQVGWQDPLNGDLQLEKVYVRDGWVPVYRLRETTTENDA